MRIDNFIIPILHKKKQKQADGKFLIQDYSAKKKAGAGQNPNVSSI